MAHVFYPSCKVRLLLRFEDFIPTPTTPAPAIPGEPEAFGGQTFEQLKFDIVPYNANITRNSYREADTATVTIPFKALPLDPRILRGVAIQIFCGTVDAGAYAEGMGPAGQGLGAPLTVVSDSQDPTSVSLSNETFRGFVDRVSIEQDGDDTITLECRDLTAIFIDEEVQTQGLSGIPKDLPLDLVIQQIILGEAVAQTLPKPPPLKWTVAQRQTVRGQRREITKACTAGAAKLAQLTALLPALTLPTLIAKVTTEIAQLTAQQVECQAALAVLTASEASIEALPLLAQRFGIPGARGTVVKNETRFPVMPTLAETKGVKWFDSKGTTKKAPSAGSRERINYWDLITDICVASGFIVYIRSPKEALPGGVIPPAELVITEPRTYYGEQLPGGLPNPNAQLPLAARDLHEFSYGFNANSINLERNLTGKNAPAGIQINARIAETGDMVSARFPPTDADPTGASPSPANRAAPSMIGDKETIQTMTYKGDIPKARAGEILSLIAEKVYEELSRGEFGVTIRTKDMMFRPSNNLKEAETGLVVADVFELQAGDSVRVGTITHTPAEIERALVTQAGIFRGMGLGERIKMFIEIGLSVLAAVQAAEAYENAQFPEVFRVNTVGIDFDHNEGFDFEIQAVNYLDARNALANVEGL